MEEFAAASGRILLTSGGEIGGGGRPLRGSSSILIHSVVMGGLDPRVTGTGWTSAESNRTGNCCSVPIDLSEGSHESSQYDRDRRREPDERYRPHRALRASGG